MPDLTIFIYCSGIDKVQLIFIVCASRVSQLLVHQFSLVFNFSQFYFQNLSRIYHALWHHCAAPDWLRFSFACVWLLLVLINQSVLLLLPLGEWRRKARCHASVATECGTINATERRYFRESRVELSWVEVKAELPATCSRGNQSAADDVAAVAVAVAAAARHWCTLAALATHSELAFDSDVISGSVCSLSSFAWLDCASLLPHPLQELCVACYMRRI